MRKIICLLLVLALCVGLCGTVYAAVNSPGQGGEAPTVPGGDVGGGDGGGSGDVGGGDGGGNSGGKPETGDNAAMGTWLLVMLAALVALVIVVVCYFKFMKK